MAKKGAQPAGKPTPDELHDKLESYFSGLIAQRNKIINELERKFRVGGNPLAAWDAFMFCREWKLPIPEWVLQYLDGAAKRLMSTVPGKETGVAQGEHVLEAFGMKTRGKGNTFNRYSDSIIRHVVVRMVLAKINENPKRMKADIFSEVAEELEEKKHFISNVTIENWYNELKGKL